MDLAYDHIQEEAYPKDREEPNETPKPEVAESSLNNDLQDAYKAISSSAWGIRIGGFLGNVMKQGESVYAQAQKELAEVGEDATKGFTDLRESLINRTRSLSMNTATPNDGVQDGDDTQPTPTKTRADPSDDVSEQSETVLSRLRVEAAKRLKDLQRAEDAADEALLRFGSNVRDFLRDAITVAPPEESSSGSTVLFESKDAHGKRVIHSSRFDAQMHVIHTSTEGFTSDPAGDEFEKWTKDFNVEETTGEIATDLAKYPELRASMEKLVPDQVSYADFWKRYYFLRHGIETAESRRRDLLKAASAEDEVGWDDDSDEEATEVTDNIKTVDPKPSSSAASSTTTQRQNVRPKPTESRKSNDEKSLVDSEASYDVVGAASGKASQAPSSPKESKKGDDSDDDWE